MLEIPMVVATRAFSRWNDDGNCFVTTYAPTKNGYATIGWTDEDGKRHATTVHRAAWACANGQPGEDTVDHTCRNRRCVRIDHLRLLTNESNGRMNAAAGHYDPSWSCHRNHPAERRRVRKNGRTYCLDCNLIAQAKYQTKARS